MPASSSVPATASTTQNKPLTPDLITRYNLQAKIAEVANQGAAPESAVPETTEAGKQKQGQAWSQNKGERQALLQRRREEMILAARRKMEAKVAAEAQAKSVI